MRSTRLALGHGRDAVRSSPSFCVSRQSRGSLEAVSPGLDSVAGRLFAAREGPIVTSRGRRPLASWEGDQQTNGKVLTVEVKIGVTDSPRELILNSAQTPAEVEKSVADALGAEGAGVLSLTDDKGRRFLVQSAKIAYVEIGAVDSRRVGFGVGAVGTEATKSAG